MTVRELAEVCEAAAARLAAAGIDEARLDAELLLADLLGCSITGLRLGPRAVDDALLAAYNDRIVTRAARVPLPYIIGWQEFYGLRLAVDRRVLIPRWDSEPVCEALADELGPGPARLADLGTGSGALAAALAKLLPEAEVWAVDDDPGAHAVATANFASLGFTDRIHAVLGNLGEPLAAAGLQGSFDGVISNPPYIPSGVVPTLAPEVRGHEPRHALDGGLDGLRLLAQVIPVTAGLLRPGGSAVVECGSDQAEAVAGMVARHPLLEVRQIVRDLGGRNRAVLFRRAA